MTIKIHFYLILVLWTIHLIQMKNDYEKEPEGKIIPNPHQGFRFLYWDDLGDTQSEVDNQKK